MLGTRVTVTWHDTGDPLDGTDDNIASDEVDVDGSVEIEPGNGTNIGGTSIGGMIIVDGILFDSEFIDIQSETLVFQAHGSGDPHPADNSSGNHELDAGAFRLIGISDLRSQI